METMKTLMMEVYETGWAMRKYGGTFVRSLGITLGHADPGNAAKLKAAFPELWLEYHGIGKKEHDLLEANKNKFRCLSCNTFFDQTTDMNYCPECGDHDIELNDGSLPE